MVKDALKLNPNEFTILDIGCGMNKYAGKSGQRVVGIDKVKTSCVDVVCNTDKGIPFSDNSIDMIYMDNSLEHMADFEFQMREIWRTLKWGGGCDD